VIVSGVYFNGLITITNSILGFQKRFGFNSILAGIASISNIILNFILIPQYGIIGSAFATLFAYFLYFIIGAISSKPLLQKIVDVKTIAVPVLVIAIGTITSGLFYDIFGHHNSMIEIFLKLIVFILSCISFFGFKIITIKDFGNSLSLFSRSK
jgi:O-antigen/teichoic acid export membrane protein